MSIAYGLPLPGFAPGDLVPNPDGTVSIRKPSGHYVTVTPDGKVEERPLKADGTPEDRPEVIAAYRPGAWESYHRGKTSVLAERDGKVWPLLIIE